MFHSQDSPWVNWAMRGAKFKLLSVDPKTGRFTILIKSAPGVIAPMHRHIGAVEAFVIEGGFHYHDDPSIRFTAGSYLLEKEGAVHQPITPEGAVLLATFYGPVEGLDAQNNVTGCIDWKWHVDAWNAAGGNYVIS